MCTGGRDSHSSHIPSEQTSNNRVKSAYPNRQSAPIDQVPDAGARNGLPNGLEMPQASLGLGMQSGSPSGGSPVPVPSVAVTDDSTPFSLDEEPAGGSSSGASLPKITSQTQIKRPMGPRTKGTQDNIPLSQVSSPSPSPEPVAAV